METEKVDFTDIPWGGVQWTMLCTLYLRAYESRAQPSILQDHAAADAVERIEYDFDRMRRALRPQSNQYTVALRARQIDEWATAFLTRHPSAVVLHLACGLDSRAFRLRLPQTVSWYDVDVPTVIDLRRRLYTDDDRYHMIGTSVTDEGWLDKIPADCPALILAEGLLPYLTREEGHTLLNRLTDHFQTGELVFDTLQPWIVRLNKIQHWGIRDEREILRANAHLRFEEKTSSTAKYGLITSNGYRRLLSTLEYVPLMRHFSMLYRFTF